MATSGTTVHGRQGARSVTGGHRAKSTKDWHQACGIKLFAGWPGNSPDLNPIKNLWSQIKHLQRKEQETSNKGIKKVARKVWRATVADEERPVKRMKL